MSHAWKDKGRPDSDVYDERRLEQHPLWPGSGGIWGRRRPEGRQGSNATTFRAGYREQRALYLGSIKSLFARCSGTLFSSWEVETRWLGVQGQPSCVRPCAPPYRQPNQTNKKDVCHTNKDCIIQLAWYGKVTQTEQIWQQKFVSYSPRGWNFKFQLRVLLVLGNGPIAASTWLLCAAWGAIEDWGSLILLLIRTLISLDQNAALQAPSNFRGFRIGLISQ